MNRSKIKEQTNHTSTQRRLTLLLEDEQPRAVAHTLCECEEDKDFVVVVALLVLVSAHAVLLQSVVIETEEVAFAFLMEQLSGF